jgi:hypothetical protein
MRLMLTALTAAMALLVFPHVGHAAVTFGSRLNHDPANSGECMALGAPCTIASFIHPSDPNGDPYSGGAPVDGVITKFRIRAFGGGDKPATFTFRLAEVTLPDPMNPTSALAIAAGTGPTATVPADSGGDTPISAFPGRLPVKRGEHLAVDGTNLNATVNSSGDKFSYVFAPPLVDGEGERGATDATGELLVQAVIEPDADRDGFGDETQDGCPSQSATQGACVTDTGQPPAVSALRVGGGKIAYALSKASSVSLLLQKSVTGRKVRGRCVSTTRANRRRPHCTRLIAVGHGFAGPGNAGANSLALPKLHGRALGPGLYRLTLTVTDAAGHTAGSTKQFRVKARSSS